MRKFHCKRLTSLFLLLILLLSSTLAAADRVTSDGRFVYVYEEMDYDTFVAGVRISEQEVDPPVSGWYYIKYYGNWYYARASELTRLDATPAPTQAPTLPPGVTASPKPSATPSIDGEIDTSYQGTILNYTVPAGGLWLYGSIDGSAVESVKAGTAIKLTSAQDGWYSTYYNGKTYYVPASILQWSTTDVTPAPANVKSIQLTAEVELYTSFNSSTKVLSNPTGNKLAAGTWVNVKFHTQVKGIDPFTGQKTTNTNETFDIYIYTIGSTSYYFNGTGAPKSSASVGSNTDTALMTEMTVVEGTKLYRAQVTNNNFYKLPQGTTLYGVKVDSDWYKVQYGAEIFYVLAADVLSASQVAVSGNTATNTYWVTAGSSGAKLYASRVMTNGKPSGQQLGMLAAGQSVLASPYDNNWYTYVKDNTVHYLYAGELGAATANSATSSTRVYLTAGTKLFERMVDGANTGKIISFSDYYVVQTVDSKWYSIVYDNETLYVLRTEVNTSRSYLTVTFPEDYPVRLWENVPGGEAGFPATLSGSVTLWHPVDNKTTNPVTPQDPLYYGLTYNGSEHLIGISEVEALLKNSKAYLTVTFPAGSLVTLWKNVVGGSASFTAELSGTYKVWYPVDNMTTPEPTYDDPLYYGITYQGEEHLIERGVVDALQAHTVSQSGYYTIEIELGTELYRNGANVAAVKNISGTYVASEAKTVTNNNASAKGDAGAFFSVQIGGLEYLVLKSAVHTSAPIAFSGDQNAATPIANLTVGKTYYVVIGITGATLYTDSTCSTVASLSLTAGEVVLAKKYTDSLYIVNNAYLPVRYIASIKSADDASVVGAIDQSGSIGDIVSGQPDSSFTQTVFSYTIPTGGLWLYNSTTDTTGAMSLNAGKTIQINALDPSHPDVGSWYTTWYGGKQYFVPKASLTVASTDVKQGASYSIVLNQPVTLYTNAACTAAYKTSIELGPDRVNVKVQSVVKATGTGATGERVTYSHVYSDGKTYYFYDDTRSNAPGGTDSPAVNHDETLAALITLNTNASLITQITLGGEVTLRSSPSGTSTYITVGPNPTDPNTNVELLYGIVHDSQWYKVVYNNATWYLARGDSGIAPNGVEQISVSTDAGSTTFTVIIGPNGARIYTQPSTNTSIIYKSGVTPKETQYLVGEQNWLNFVPGGNNVPGNGETFSAGKAVLASRYSSTWYTCTYDGQTVYFQNNASSNANSTAAVSSYIIHLTGSNSIDLYTTITSTGRPVNNPKLTGGGTTEGNYYTLRTVDKTWSSIGLSNRTYYVKNAEIPKAVAESSIPVASTSVGNTYRITLGGTEDITVWPSSTLRGTKLGTLKAGFQTTGTKMYDEANRTMVYKVPFGGTYGYIDAQYVFGVASGDEVTEAQLAAQQQQQTETGDSSVEVGETVMQTLSAGTVLYASQSTSASSVSLPIGSLWQLKKENANWYSLTYNGQTYFIPASAIETSSGTTQTQVTVSVGETYTYTFTVSTPTFEEPETGLAIFNVILTGQTYPLKKISEDWYEVKINGKIQYVEARDVILPYIDNTPTDPNLGAIHDGTGYITAKLLIAPSSGSVNLRKSATTGSTILDRIPKGTEVANLGYTVDGNQRVWYKVSFKTFTGYVLGDYVAPVGTADGSSTSADPSLDIGRALTVNTANVNVRSGPGTNYSILGRLEKNTVVVPLEYKIGNDNLVWYRFQYSASATGYIRSDYLAGSAASTAEQSGNVAIKAGGTNLRSGPGESFSVIARLNRDEIVTVLGTGTDGNNTLWYRVVSINSTLSGYVRSDLVRQLTAAEQSALMQSVVGQYTELRYGSSGEAVRTLQQQLIVLGYLAAGSADGMYGQKTVDAVKAYQSAKGLSQTGVATAALQAQIFNTTSVTPGSVLSLDWFTTGYALINANRNIQVYDINSGTTWNARYIEGSNHADVIPASAADAAKLTANNITGDWRRRPVIVTIAGTKYAGSMYAVGHGDANHCTYFKGVMCIHFTGSKTHGTNNVDADHQAAIQDALKYANTP